MADTWQDFQLSKKTGQNILTELKKSIAAYGCETVLFIPHQDCLLFKIIRENDGLTTVFGEIFAFLGFYKYNNAYLPNNFDFR
jgi:uncharacterized protein YtpQ (UPF0354 family)